MYVARTFRMSAAAVAAVLTVGTVGTTAAQARPPAPKPTGFAASVTGHENGSYDIDASWNVSTNATSYRVSLTKGGATLASAKVPTNSWSPTVTTSPGTASLSVRAVVGKHPGKTATFSVTLPDATAPRGSYSSAWVDNVATITQDSLTDNSPVSQVTRTIDWKDGTAAEDWPAGTTIRTHTYPLAENRYVPTVRLEDASGNVRFVDAQPIVINDSQDPTGTFVNQTATAWAGYDHVKVSQSAIHDNWTPDGLITRSVDWGDGTTTDWTSGTTTSHVYADAGTYIPIVTITDEAHRAAQVPTSQAVVTADTIGPRVRLTLPRAKHSVKAWRTLRGKATDAQTGVKSVSVKAVEKRGGSWFGYKAATHRWVKAGSKAKAFSRARAFTLTTNGKHQWAAKLAKLRKGTLAYKVRAVDQVHNLSVTVTHRARLTRS